MQINVNSFNAVEIGQSTHVYVFQHLNRLSFDTDLVKIWEILSSRSQVRCKETCLCAPVCVCRCVSSVHRVCIGVRHRWTAGVSVVLNHSPLPSSHTHTHIHTITCPIPHLLLGNAPSSIPSSYFLRLHTKDRTTSPPK